MARTKRLTCIALTMAMLFSVMLSPMPLPAAAVSDAQPTIDLIATRVDKPDEAISAGNPLHIGELVEVAVQLKPPADGTTAFTYQSGEVAIQFDDRYLDVMKYDGTAPYIDRINRVNAPGSGGDASTTDSAMYAAMAACVDPSFLSVATGVTDGGSANYEFAQSTAYVAQGLGDSASEDLGGQRKMGIVKAGYTRKTDAATGADGKATITDAVDFIKVKFRVKALPADLTNPSQLVQVADFAANFKDSFGDAQGGAANKLLVKELGATGANEPIVWECNYDNGPDMHFAAPKLIFSAYKDSDNSPVTDTNRVSPGEAFRLDAVVEGVKTFRSAAFTYKYDTNLLIPVQTNKNGDEQYVPLVPQSDSVDTPSVPYTQYITQDQKFYIEDTWQVNAQSHLNLRSGEVEYALTGTEEHATSEVAADTDGNYRYTVYSMKFMVAGDSFINTADAIQTLGAEELAVGGSETPRYENGYALLSGAGNPPENGGVETELETIVLAEGNLVKNPVYLQATTIDEITLKAGRFDIGQDVLDAANLDDATLYDQAAVATKTTPKEDAVTTLLTKPIQAGTNERLIVGASVDLGGFSGKNKGIAWDIRWDGATGADATAGFEVEEDAVSNNYVFLKNITRNGVLVVTAVARDSLSDDVTDITTSADKAVLKLQVGNPDEEYTAPQITITRVANDPDTAPIPVPGLQNNTFQVVVTAKNIEQIASLGQVISFDKDYIELTKVEQNLYQASADNTEVADANKLHVYGYYDPSGDDVTEATYLARANERGYLGYTLAVADVNAENNPGAAYALSGDTPIITLTFKALKYPLDEDVTILVKHAPTEIMPNTNGVRLIEAFKAGGEGVVVDCEGGSYSYVLPGQKIDTVQILNGTTVVGATGATDGQYDAVQMYTGDLTSEVTLSAQSVFNKDGYTQIDDSKKPEDYTWSIVSGSGAITLRDGVVKVAKKKVTDSSITEAVVKATLGSGAEAIEATAKITLLPNPELRVGNFMSLPVEDSEHIITKPAAPIESLKAGDEFTADLLLEDAGLLGGAVSIAQLAAKLGYDTDLLELQAVTYLPEAPDGTCAAYDTAALEAAKTSGEIPLLVAPTSGQYTKAGTVEELAAIPVVRVQFKVKSGVSGDVEFTFLNRDGGSGDFAQYDYVKKPGVQQYCNIAENDTITIPMAGATMDIQRYVKLTGRWPEGSTPPSEDMWKTESHVDTDDGTKNYTGSHRLYRGSNENEIRLKAVPSGEGEVTWSFVGSGTTDIFELEPGDNNECTVRVPVSTGRAKITVAATWQGVSALYELELLARPFLILTHGLWDSSSSTMEIKNDGHQYTQDDKIAVALTIQGSERFGDAQAALGFDKDKFILTDVIRTDAQTGGDTPRDLTFVGDEGLSDGEGDMREEFAKIDEASVYGTKAEAIAAANTTGIINYSLARNAGFTDAIDATDLRFVTLIFVPKDVTGEVTAPNIKLEDRDALKDGFQYRMQLVDSVTIPPESEGAEAQNVQLVYSCDQEVKLHEGLRVETTSSRQINLYDPAEMDIKNPIPVETEGDNAGKYVFNVYEGSTLLADAFKGWIAKMNPTALDDITKATADTENQTLTAAGVSDDDKDNVEENAETASKLVNVKLTADPDEAATPRTVGFEIGMLTPVDGVKSMKTVTVRLTSNAPQIEGADDPQAPIKKAERDVVLNIYPSPQIVAKTYSVIDGVATESSLIEPQSTVRVGYFLTGLLPGTELDSLKFTATIPEAAGLTPDTAYGTDGVQPAAGDWSTATMAYADSKVTFVSPTGTALTVDDTATDLQEVELGSAQFTTSTTAGTFDLGFSDTATDNVLTIGDAEQPVDTPEKPFEIATPAFAFQFAKDTAVTGTGADEDPYTLTNPYGAADALRVFKNNATPVLLGFTEGVSATKNATFDGILKDANGVVVEYLKAGVALADATEDDWLTQAQIDALEETDALHGLKVTVTANTTETLEEAEKVNFIYVNVTSNMKYTGTIRIKPRNTTPVPAVLNLVPDNSEFTFTAADGTAITDPVGLYDNVAKTVAIKFTTPVVDIAEILHDGANVKVEYLPDGEIDWLVADGADGRRTITVAPATGTAPEAAVLVDVTTDKAFVGKIRVTAADKKADGTDFTAELPIGLGDFEFNFVKPDLADYGTSDRFTGFAADGETPVPAIVKFTKPDTADAQNATLDAVKKEDGEIAVWYSKDKTTWTAAGTEITDETNPLYGVDVAVSEYTETTPYPTDLDTKTYLNLTVENKGVAFEGFIAVKSISGGEDDYVELPVNLPSAQTDTAFEFVKDMNTEGGAVGTPYGEGDAITLYMGKPEKAILGFTSGTASFDALLKTEGETPAVVVEYYDPDYNNGEGVDAGKWLTQAEIAAEDANLSGKVPAGLVITVTEHSPVEGEDAANAPFMYVDVTANMVFNGKIRVKNVSGTDDAELPVKALVDYDVFIHNLEDVYFASSSEVLGKAHRKVEIRLKASDAAYMLSETEDATDNSASYYATLKYKDNEEDKEQPIYYAPDTKAFVVLIPTDMLTEEAITKASEEAAFNGRLDWYKGEIDISFIPKGERDEDENWARTLYYGDPVVLDPVFASNGFDEGMVNTYVGTGVTVVNVESYKIKALIAGDANGDLYLNGFDEGCINDWVGQTRTDSEGNITADYNYYMTANQLNQFPDVPVQG